MENNLNQQSRPRHTKTDSADVCSTFSDVEQLHCFHHEGDDERPVVDVVNIIVPYTTGIVHYE